MVRLEERRSRPAAEGLIGRSSHGKGAHQGMVAPRCVGGEVPEGTRSTLAKKVGRDAAHPCHDDVPAFLPALNHACAETEKSGKTSRRPPGPCRQWSTTPSSTKWRVHFRLGYLRLLINGRMECFPPQYHEHHREVQRQITGSASARERRGHRPSESLAAQYAHQRTAGSTRQPRHESHRRQQWPGSPRSSPLILTCCLIARTRTVQAPSSGLR